MKGMLTSYFYTFELNINCILAMCGSLQSFVFEAECKNSNHDGDS